MKSQISNQTEIINLLEKNNLDYLIPRLKTCYNLEYNLKITNKNPKKDALGYNKFGGRPHLPKNTDWPKINNHEATFVCQINLENLEMAKLGLGLPKTGLLSFFVHSLFETKENYSEDFDYNLPNCKIIYSQITDLEVKNYPAIFFEKLEYEETESKLVSQKIVKLDKNLDKNTDLKPPTKPKIDANWEELEKYKLEYDFYVARKYPGLISYDSKPKIIYEYEKIVKKMSKNLYEFPFSYGSFQAEIENVFKNSFVDEFEDEFRFDLELSFSLPSDLDCEYLDELQTKIVEEIINPDILARFGGDEFGVQGFDKETIHKEICIHKSRKNKEISFEDQKSEAIHFLSFFDLTSLLGISNYGESMTFFGLTKSNFEDIWLEIQCD